MRIVVLTNRSTHGQRILEEFKRSGIPVAGVLVECGVAPKRPPLSTCLKELGYQTTASVLYRDLCEVVWLNLQAVRYKRFTPFSRRDIVINSWACQMLVA